MILVRYELEVAGWWWCCVGGGICGWMLVVMVVESATVVAQLRDCDNLMPLVESKLVVV